MSRILIIFCFCLFGFFASAQLSFKVVPFFNAQNYYEPTKQVSKSNDIQIQSLRFYLSAIKLLQHNKVIWAEKNSYHLMDLERMESFKLPLHSPKNIDFDAVELLLGIDSITNVSGSMDGDLDPTKGMYWAWQSGYINFKIEGKCAKSAAKDKSFELHLGGYLSPFLSAQKIRFAVKNKKEIVLKMDLDQFLSTIDFAKTHHIMSPSAAAVLLSGQAAQMFSIIENEN